MCFLVLFNQTIINKTNNGGNSESNTAQKHQPPRTAGYLHPSQRFHLSYSHINQTLNDKIVNRIQLVQQVYLEDYKNQVKTMAEELKNIRQVLDEELLRQRCKV